MFYVYYRHQREKMKINAIPVYTNSRINAHAFGKKQNTRKHNTQKPMQNIPRLQKCFRLWQH